MITWIEGVLAERQPARIVMDVQGIGYEIFIPLSSFDRLPETGTNCRVLIYDHFREDNRQLFGFCTEEERDLFAKLMGVSGIGPKLALSALSSLSVREIKLAVAEGDTKRLSSISGVGKKVAERLIVELRSKISSGDELEAKAGHTGEGPADHRLRDVVLALVALGYKQADARKMLERHRNRINIEMPVEEIVRLLLTG